MTHLRAYDRAVERPHADDGFTLVELLVAMLVFAVFLTILVGTVIGITRASSRAQLLSQSSSSLLLAFQNLDRQIRYANSVNFPGLGASGASYFEFRVAAESSTTGYTTCSQWRFVPATKSIESRQWRDGVPFSPTSWSTKVSSVLDTGAANYPFQLLPATVDGLAKQQLTLTVSSGTDLINPGASISTTFVARNSSIQSPSNSNALVPGTSDTPICAPTGYRP